MSLSYSHGREFITDIRPLLEYGDIDLLVRHLSQFWTDSKLVGLLTCEHEEAVKASLFCLSLVGTMEDNAAIAAMLTDDDAPIATMAEYALWSVWFRAGNEKANADLLRAVRLISRNKLTQSVHLLDGIVERCPSFAEAYNQRAIVYFLKEDYQHAMADCEITLHLNPHHFGALAGLGHCYVAIGQLEKALEAYCHALQAHPRQEGIRQSIQHVRANLKRGAKDSSISPDTIGQWAGIRPNS